MGHILRTAASYLRKLEEAQYGIPAPLANAINYYWDSQFSKVDERNAKEPRRWTPPDPHVHIRELWLQCELYTAVTLNRTYPSWAKALQSYAFYCLFSGPSAQYRLVPFLDAYEFREMLKGHYAYRVQSEQLETAPKKLATMAVFGNFFVEHIGSGAHLMVTLDLGYESMANTITVMAGPDHRQDVEQFFADMEASIQAHDIYFKQCLQFIQGKLSFADVRPTSWDGIVIKDELKNKIQRNTVDILAKSEQFSALGMCPNQNMLLCSPPGMAKTSIFRAISHQVEGQITRIWCTGKSIDSARDVTSLFDAARTLAPCIIFLEDADLFCGERVGNHESHVLNEFLACLDGAMSNEGVVVMASTNDLDSMDEAVVQRPGRFDMKIEMPLPDSEDRAKMLAKFLLEFHAKPLDSVSQEFWTTIIDMMEGLTGDYIRSLARAVVINAVNSGQVSEDGLSCSFGPEDLTIAAEQIMRNYRIGLRAKKHYTFQAEVESAPKAIG